MKVIPIQGGAAIRSPWLTVKEDAKYCNMGKNRIYEAMKAGELPSVGRGTRLLHVKVLDAWLAANNPAPLGESDMYLPIMDPVTGKVVK